jgi:serine/threonine protein kinase
MEITKSRNPTMSKPGVVRYMAPELLSPSKFNLTNSNPTKESDIYSLVVTTYEVCPSCAPCAIIVEIALLC